METKGERVRIYDDHLLCEQRAKEFSAIEWPAVGLPQHTHPLLAPRDFTFTTKGERIVSHGGISLEEVIVPFVQVTGTR